MGFFIPGGNIAIDGNISADRRKFHVVSRCNLAIILQTSVRFQRNIAFSVRSIALRLKFRADLEHAFGFFVFYCNIAVDHGLDGKVQLIRAVQYRNAALDGIVCTRALYRKDGELVARSHQRYIFRAGGSHLLRPDARRCVLGNARICRSQRHILPCGEGRIRSLRQVTLRCQVNVVCSGEIPLVGQCTVSSEVFDRDIPCHIPVDRNGQRTGIVLNANTAVNGRLLSLVSRDAVHSDVIELISCIFQQQGFAVEGLDRIGSNASLVCLGDVSANRFQRQRLFRILQITHCYRAVQRQTGCSGKRRIAAGLDGTFHCLFLNRTDTVLFFFPSHGQLIITFRDEFTLGIDIPKHQGSVMDAPDIRGSRFDVHRGAVIQDADRIARFAHNAGGLVRIEHQLLAGLDVGFRNPRIGAAHLEALFACNGNRVSCEHGSQAEIIAIVHVFDEDIFVGPGLCQIPGQGNGQRLILFADALLAAGQSQVVSPDIGSIYIRCIVDALFRIQAHIALCAVIRGVNRSHLDGGMLCRILTARHGDVAAGLHVQRTGCPDAKRQIALDLEG